LFSQRQGVQIAVHLPLFLAHLQRFFATRILEHVTGNHYQTLSESFHREMGSALPQLDTKFDGIMLLEIILLHFCDTVTKHTFKQTTTGPHIFMLALSNLD
jgi:hypothetical protein